MPLIPVAHGSNASARVSARRHRPFRRRSSTRLAAAGPPRVPEPLPVHFAPPSRRRSSRPEPPPFLAPPSHRRSSSRPQATAHCLAPPNSRPLPPRRPHVLLAPRIGRSSSPPTPTFPPPASAVLRGSSIAYRPRARPPPLIPDIVPLPSYISVPSLGRTELETACEDFSNVISTVSDCALYKGTLSSGVEIAVSSSPVKSAEEWSDRSEEQFRNKISVLSNVVHVVPSLSICTLEKQNIWIGLHRLRIIMGSTYCLEHMNQLDPPVTPRTLSSSSIYLTDDYAAKICDAEFWKDDKDAASMQTTDQESIVYKFGILLLEVISGRLQFSEDHGLLVLRALSYLDGKRPLNAMADPTLTSSPSSVPDEDLAALCDVVRLCINRETEKRPTMGDVARLMKGIIALSPEQTIPRDNLLWSAELEIVSPESS